MIKSNVVCGISLLCGIFNISYSYATDIVTANDIIVKSAVKHDLSPLPLGYMHAKQNFLLHHTNFAFNQLLTDANTFPTQLNAPFLVPLKGYQGLGIGFGDYQITAERPDPVSSVGIHQFVQAVNSDLVVLDKSTGQPLAGFPKPLNDLWAGFGSVCETQNGGGATVKYDQLAKRWIISKPAYENENAGPFYECYAVSTSEDATGTYYRYAFRFGSRVENNRLGLWPNAYLFGADLKGPNRIAPIMCALQRFRMVSGLPANMQCKVGESLADPIQPIDLDGRGLPSTPGFFASLAGPEHIMLYRFKVDFDNPAESIVTDYMLPVNSFEEACPLSHGVACAIQPNTSNRLNLYSNQLANRFVYREQVDHGTLLLSHTVKGPAPKHSPAIRWYELRIQTDDPSATPVVYQQATLAPDSKNRFIGSIAIDRFDNIAIAYTVTSSLIYPSIEMAVHHFTDPMNQLTIQPLATSRGSQIDGIHEWANQGSMSVDPVDECTFWYNGEYLKTTGSLNWSTFILKFKLTACT